ncbi:MAG: hypothetical protein FJ279_04560 [Planctomycetes bacterium]|nr:hypothetical protein [Planctomycetota bacterium]MBM4084397.1 hypothetical protein [Planctomycetota bacterium]
MITREEAVWRLGRVAQEIGELKAALEQGWDEGVTRSRTEAFLEKCGGWEDTRSPEEVIAQIYAARTASDRTASLFEGKSS